LQEVKAEPNVGDEDILVRWLAAPIDPADINAFQGQYPIRPSFPAVAGNNGVGVVERVGKAVGSKFVAGDRVVPIRPALGTWRNFGVAHSSSLQKVSAKIPLEYAATLAVNPTTAYRLLNDFVQLKKGDVVIQNGATSQVGQTLLQLAKLRGITTINIIRAQRPDAENTIERLKMYSGGLVVTDDYVGTPEYRKLVSDLPKPKLALNCVGGRIATEMARTLAPGGVMVTYGGMSQKSVELPTSLFIFNDIQLRGFWISKWVQEHTAQERDEMFNALTDLISEDKLRMWLERHRLTDWKTAITVSQTAQQCRKVVLALDE